MPERTVRTQKARLTMVLSNEDRWMAAEVAKRHGFKNQKGDPSLVDAMRYAIKLAYDNAIPLDALRQQGVPSSIVERLAAEDGKQWLEIRKL